MTGFPVKFVLLSIAFCFPLFCGNYKVKTKRAGSSSEEPAIFIFGYIFYRTLIIDYMSVFPRKTAIFVNLVNFANFYRTIFCLWPY